jgi:cytochrome P450
VPSYHVGHDPAYYENPDEFDGFRFEKMRKVKGFENKYQFSMTGYALLGTSRRFLFDVSLMQSNRKDFLSFGHGNHSCPGRFFAGEEMKLVLAYLIQNYDIKLANENAGRPANIVDGFRIRPDVTKLVLLRKRTVKSDFEKR